MIVQYTLFVNLAPVSILVTGAILLYANRHRYTGQTISLVWLSASILGWLISNTFELIASTAVWTLFWAKVTYIFIAATPVAWLAFAARYTGQPRWPSRTYQWILSIIPAITIFLAITNDYHHLVWTNYTFTPVHNMLAMNVEHGSWFWVFAIYTYALVFTGAVIIGQHYLKPIEIYRQQSAWLLIGALVPVFSNLIYLFKVIPGLQKDYTPLSFVFAGIAFTIDIYHYRLFDLLPIARDLVIDSSTDAMITLDALDRVVDMNPAALQLQSEGLELSIGESIEKLYESADLFYQPTGDLTFQQDIVMTLGSVERYFDMRSMPVLDKRGILVGRSFVLRDISERKRVELALRQQTMELEERNRELDAFAHTVAHDLKGPMGTAVGYASMLRDVYLQMPEKEFLESLDGITASAAKMSQIVDSLLLLSQVRKLEDVPIDVMDMGTTVIRALERVDDMIEEYGAKIVLPPNWPFVVGYSPWVEEVWVNYISNALKYGGQPEQNLKPVIELGWDTREKEQEGPAGQTEILRFWVRDNGKGLSNNDREQLFVEFTRLEHRLGEGHGLGLSIVKRIVDKLNGVVGVESSTGKGNLFYFTLPPYDFT
jgi:signal transduction histidine kinase